VLEDSLLDIAGHPDVQNTPLATQNIDVVNLGHESKDAGSQDKNRDYFNILRAIWAKSGSSEEVQRRFRECHPERRRSRREGPYVGKMA
jgi:hypothetical protein